MNSRTDLLIVQPYVPHYRVPFFTRLAESLDARGVGLTVAGPGPHGTQAARNDEALGEIRWIRTKGRTISTPLFQAQTFGVSDLVAQAGATIIGLYGTSPDVYRLALRRMVRGTRLGLWGHVKTYVGKPNRLDTGLEGWLLRHSDHVFAYTPSGAEYAAQQGVNRHLITTVMNSVETSGLVRLTKELRQETQGTPAALDRTIGYIGGLDGSKRVRLLAESLDHLWDLDPTVHVLVGGEGVESHLLGKARDRGQAVLLGFANESVKARIAAHSRILINPGRIGLIAVEALAVELPLLTTDNAYHGPEFEYLTPGVSVHSTPPDPRLYALGILSLLDRTPIPALDGRHPSLDGMVERFAQGVLALLNSRPK